MQIILLPGMDGTGELFSSFVSQTPEWLKSVIVSYPRDVILNYDELTTFALQFIDTTRPFALLGESFSGPVAINLAAKNPENLTGLILCASFMQNPRPGFSRLFSRHLTTLLFSRPMPNWLIKFLLLGDQYSNDQILAFKSAISSVKPAVLSARIKMIINCYSSGRLLSNCQSPILYIRATKDKLVNKKAMLAIDHAADMLTIEEIDAPHLVLQTQCKASWQHIENFLNTCKEQERPIST